MIRALIVALAVSLAGNVGLGWYSQVSTRNAELALANAKADQREAVIQQQGDQINTLQAINQRHDALQAEVHQVVASLGDLATRNVQRYERLERENQALRTWGDTLLPADLVRLRQRPAFDTAAAYRQWLSDTDQMFATTSQPPDEPGLETRP
ncbi:hypothetical protein GCM10007907_20460 [Chitinimonas prasina]|uniref:LysB family phage lysis regulatory protein n=1 Tax=Chitinimonas prasina TaxID=1434937 RepID=A0ABQ5YFA4_9NEIS|nr:Rz-like lysis system protein LysB [Chitinimonas prasina]GLR13256.1 hypothetical protein GCM10007907_20460 [Chitinimonas prasina]